MEKAFWTCVVSFVFCQSVAGFTSDTLVSVSRYHSADTVEAGDTMVVRFQVENNQSSSLTGFFLSDQIPSGFTVLHSTIHIDGVDVSDYLYEVADLGEIYGGNRPHRWILETPPAFDETNPILPGGTAEVQYTIECTEVGTHVFRNFGWAAAVFRESDTLWVFGYDDDSLRVVVSGVGVNEGRLSEEFDFRLLPSYPNPFRNSTTVAYELPGESHVSVRVYDSSGRLVRNLFEGQQFEGRHYISWDRSDLADGVYFLHLEAGQYATTKKAVLTK